MCALCSTTSSTNLDDTATTFLAFRALDMGNKWDHGDVGYIRAYHVPWTIWYLLLVKKDLMHFTGLGT